jgi:hypothetical protein
LSLCIMILLPYPLMDILSLFTRCCGYRWYKVSYWRTVSYCCPGWKTSTYQNCNVGKKIDIKEGKVRLWVVKVTSTNITAISWLSVLLGVIHRSTRREPLEYPERTTSIDSGVSRENHRHTQREPLALTPDKETICMSSYFSLSKLKHPSIYLITVPPFYLLNNKWFWNQFTLIYAWLPKHFANICFQVYIYIQHLIGQHNDILFSPPPKPLYVFM